MTKRSTILGEKIHDIASFYDEVNRVFMHNETWSIGQSLDAFDDMLYGQYGAMSGDGPVEIVWRNIETSRRALGIEATHALLSEKRRHPEIFNADTIGRQLDDLERGVGKTYFDIVLNIIADHPAITLVAG
ncbi:MAG: ribonuclease inhibitor [Zymomonas sp.]|nr:MAG: ribonuclease inhibitor [Zymomonas sp.]